MRMFDGHVWTLTNVRHVPNLKKNLFSLEALKARGYKFSEADGGIKVTKGSIIILKREQTSNLHKMTVGYLKIIKRQVLKMWASLQREGHVSTKMRTSCPWLTRTSKRGSEQLHVSRLMRVWATPCLASSALWVWATLRLASHEGLTETRTLGAASTQ